MFDFPAGNAPLPQEHPPLQGIRRADAVIVGGGLTGVTLAALLSRSGLSITLLEARRIGQGASAACAGLASVNAVSAYQTIARLVNLETARTYAGMYRRAFDELQQWTEALHVPVQQTDAYLYAFLARDLDALESRYRLLRALGIPIEAAPDAGGCPFPVSCSLVTRRQLLLSPAVYLARTAQDALRHGAALFESSPATRILPGAVETTQGRVEAPVVVLASGMPAGCRRLTVLRRLEARTCAGVLLHGPAHLHTAHVSVRDGGLTLRPADEGLLASWTLGRTGTDLRAQEALLERVLRGRLPDYVPDAPLYRSEIHSADGLLLAGQLSRGVYMAGGYGGSGLLGSFLAAQTLTRLLLGRPRPEDPLLSPLRTLPGTAKARLHGMRPMLQARAAGALRLRAPRCPHMGCRLRYSPLTGRWECPCHGSAFGLFGEVLQPPALRPAPVSPRDRPQ